MTVTQIEQKCSSGSRRLTMSFYDVGFDFTWGPTYIRLFKSILVFIYFIAFVAFQIVLFATIYTNSPRTCTVCNRESTFVVILITKF